jgi:hypothetical protein
MIKTMKRSLVLSGLVLASAVVAGYRTYELRKIKKALQEEQIIDIEPEKVEELTH